MIKRIIWLVVSALMVLSLVLASCAPKVTEEKKEVVAEKKEVVVEKKEVTEKKEVVAEKEKVEMVVDALGRSVPKPQYGGVLNVAEASDPGRGFSRTDQNSTYPQGPSHVTNDTLVMRDRLKGPSGTREWTALYNIYPPPELMTGGLAESWQIIPPDTLKFKIRKGIHWQDKAPVYGAELTAEDVVYTFMARWSGKWATAGFARMYPNLSNLRSPEESIYVDSDDPGTVVFKSAAGQLGQLWEVVANFDVVVPKALGPIEGEGFSDWRGVVGTGPFLLSDYVRGSSLTWQKNPNYWGKDAFHPENQLPYLDGVKVFIIPDLSTQQAALRTGKLDILPGVEAESAESLMRSNPELKWVEKWGSPGALGMRNDVAPFNDVRVRQAMQMAINLDEMVKDYYDGKGLKFWSLAWPIPEHKLAWVPLEQMPPSVQELYTYNPDKAKRLLAEAGYPNGFTTSITVSSAAEENIDLASIVAAYWAKVGVTLKIDVREPAVLTAMQRAFTYPHGTFTGLNQGQLTKFTFWRVGASTNYARVNEPLIESTLKAVQAAYFDWAEVSRIQKEVAPQLIMLVNYIQLPSPVEYTLWQPWLMVYAGEERSVHIMEYKFAPMGRYLWIDSALKKTMGR